MRSLAIPVQVVLVLIMSAVWYWSAWLTFHSSTPRPVLWSAVLRYAPAITFLFGCVLAASVSRLKGLSRSWRLIAAAAELVAISPAILLLAFMVFKIFAT